ncbi:MAG: helix-turn-helix transcriptional regulator [Paludibacteraceae bacterium]|nr:helix-turn-helix transcriptional regulator [Paludibacteraceae bacterium]
MEKEKLHIGRIVESAFKKSNLTKSEFARRLGVYPQNLQRMFEKEDWLVSNLIKASDALNVDFSYVIKSPQFAQESKESRDVLLQIRLSPSEAERVFASLDDKSIGEIVMSK